MSTTFNIDGWARDIRQLAALRAEDVSEASGMQNKSIASLRLERYVAVVVVKDRKKFTPVAGANVSYARGYPECFVNILNVHTEGTVFGELAHASGHRDIMVWRQDSGNNLGCASLIKDLNSRSQPLAVAFSIPRAWFLPGFNKNSLSSIQDRWWRVPSGRIREGLHFEFAFWPENSAHNDADVHDYWSRLGGGEPLLQFTHNASRNWITLALYDDGPNAEVAIDFQLDASLTSSSEGPVFSAETVTLRGPRKTRKG
jgi:hypothetical protein